MDQNRFGDSFSHRAPSGAVWPLDGVPDCRDKAMITYATVAAISLAIARLATTKIIKTE